MKQTVIILAAILLFTSCTGEFVFMDTGSGASPVVVDNAVYEEVIGYETIRVDTSFYFSGHPADLHGSEFDFISCRAYYCTGSYTETVELVRQSYDITVRNDGWDPAYGLSADIRLRSDDGYNVSVYTQTIHIAERLDPDYEVSVSYPLNDGETVLSFEGINWDEYDVYMKKTREQPEYEKLFAQTKTGGKIKIALAKTGSGAAKKKKCIKSFKTGKPNL